MLGLADDNIEQLGKEPRLLLGFLLGIESALPMQLAAALEQQVRRRRFFGLLLARLGAERRRNKEEKDSCVPYRPTQKCPLPEDQKKLNHLEIPI